MKKYKCLNPECNHEWSSDIDPFECPNCGNLDFTANNEGFYSRRRLKIIGYSIFAILIFFLVNKQCSKNPDSVFKEFTQEIPEENSSNSSSNNGPDTISPEILRIDISLSKLSEVDRYYSIIVITNDLILDWSKTEYSKDNQRWQADSSFSMLDSGVCKIYARNINNPKFLVSKEFVLKPYIKSFKQLRELLGKIRLDQDSRDLFRKLLGNSLPVTGAQDISNVQELIIDVNNGKNYQIVKFEYNEENDTLTSIEVTRIN